MGVKRKAQEAFSKRDNAVRAQKPSPANGLSAFAAAKARRQPTTASDGAEDEITASFDQAAQEHVVPPDMVPVQTGTQNVDLMSVSARQAGSIFKSQPNERYPSETTTTSVQRLTGVQLASIKLNSSGHSRDSDIKLQLEQDAFVTPIGEYDLEILAGSVYIYGATLHAKSGRHRVYALSTHALPQIIAKSPDTVVRLSSVPSMANNLARFSPLCRNITAADNGKSSFSLLENSSQDPLQRSLCPLESSKRHQATLTQLAMKAESKHGRMAVAVVGGKSTGKSTFARHICNKLLTRTSHSRCLFLDLDPGQPEFGPPGQLYLVEVLTPILGPAYTHCASTHSRRYRLIAAHTIAATSFKEDPQHYMDCVAALFNHKHVANAWKDGSCPLVINTCGWATGIGANVLCGILRFEVTDAVLIDITDPTVLDQAKATCEICYEIERPSTRISNRSPAELRQIQTMAYFHARPAASTDDTADYRLAKTTIAQWRPWVVSYDDRSGSISAVVSYGQSPDPAFLAEVLEGSLVAIVTKNDQVEPQDNGRTIATSQHTPEGLPYQYNQRPFDPRLSKYHGLALVRGIDSASKQIHLITPLTPEDIAVLMQRTVSLIRGAFDSPDWAYLEAVYDSSSDTIRERPWVARREMVGVEGAVWRLRHPPTAARAVQR